MIRDIYVSSFQFIFIFMKIMKYFNVSKYHQCGNGSGKLFGDKPDCRHHVMIVLNKSACRTCNQIDQNYVASFGHSLQGMQSVCVFFEK